jgi:hypothetical protein
MVTNLNVNGVSNAAWYDLTRQQKWMAANGVLALDINPSGYTCTITYSSGAVSGSCTLLPFYLRPVISS